MNHGVFIWLIFRFLRYSPSSPTVQEVHFIATSDITKAITNSDAGAGSAILEMAWINNISEVSEDSIKTKSFQFLENRSTLLLFSNLHTHFITSIKIFNHKLFIGTSVKLGSILLLIIHCFTTL